MSGSSAPKRGPWNEYKPGWLALYGVVSLITMLFIWATWSSGGVAFPGLLGLFFFTITGRQLYLARKR